MVICGLSRLRDRVFKDFLGDLGAFLDSLGVLTVFRSFLGGLYGLLGAFGELFRGFV